jgi:hypothetical protein
VAWDSWVNVSLSSSCSDSSYVIIFIRPKFALIGILAILLSYKNIGTLFAFGTTKEFEISKNKEHVGYD